MTALEALCESKGVTIKAKHIGQETEPDYVHGGRMAKKDVWRVTLFCHGRQFTTRFYMGIGLSGRPPTAADVLACLVYDARCGEDPFETFCSDLGYDTDSRKAESTWKACRRTAPRIRRLLGDDFDIFANAEH